MDLKTLSIDQLKAKIYDSLVVVENHNQFIKILNNELQLRTVKPNEVTASEAINEKQTDETK